ncbi:SH3 domain-containing protein [Chlorogloeopsis sp. ULAP01]|uniref:SH3 domain-containing protein n=1 Tax=Chlorogloeopsis sp. ULAP01 TaxID=3056483 RepID=UPI0025AB43FA|nr:SH3 domain-containing protein [Chlorogloeopsis sp. ULAP01]MDM9382389.1 SH3 domain-containing protein [Chlorogloeopsis sp. ULAP01]
MTNRASKLLVGLIFSCVSVLVNTGIGDGSVLAKTIKQQKCNVYAYIIHQDPQGLKVRSGASPTHKILGKIPTYETVQIIAILGKWVQITNASGGFKGTGWIYLPTLGVSARGYGTEGVDLYASSDRKSKKLGRVPANVNVKLLGCRGQWAHVEYRGIKGWLAREDQCGAALTSCS